MSRKSGAMSSASTVSEGAPAEGRRRAETFARGSGGRGHGSSGASAASGIGDHRPESGRRKAYRR